MNDHGGNIYRASQEMCVPVCEIMDFSASINPLGVPGPVFEAIREGIPLLAHYPEPLAESLAAYIGRRQDIDPCSVVCGNGSTELIYLVVRALAPRRALIPAPTFSEYERACLMRRGTSRVHHALPRETDFTVDAGRFISAMAGCDIAFLCNPNNPTGRLIDRDAVLSVAQAAERLSCYLVLDEAFIDFSPEHSMIREVERNSHLIVLRSLTKYYALSGLRLGYGVFPKSLTQLMNDYKEPWTVNSLAQKAGIAALSDREYEKRTALVIREGKAQLEAGLRGLNVEFVPSMSNYYLLKMDRAQQVIVSLQKKRILVRDCSNFMGLDGTYIRIAVRSREENETLLKELARSCTA